MERPLLVTDAGLAKLPVVARTVEICREAGLGCEVFSDVQPNPVEANVTAGVDRFRAGGHDGVIAFGGGSALDIGKAIGLMVGQTRPIWDFEDKAGLVHASQRLRDGAGRCGANHRGHRLGSRPLFGAD